MAPPVTRVLSVFRSCCALQRSLAQVLRDASRFVLAKGGVVRDMENIGAQVLPYRMKAHQEYHETGRCGPRGVYFPLALIFFFFHLCCSFQQKNPPPPLQHNT